MSLERDLQSNLAVIHDAGAITLDQAGTAWSANIIDTDGFRNILIAVETDRDIDENVLVDDPRIIFQDSPDGVTYTNVAQGKVLPTRNQDVNGQLLFNPVAPYLQTFGLTSCERYVRIGVVATVLSQALTVGVGVCMEPELKAFTDYDPNFTGDGMP